MRILESIQAILNNADRLLDDATLLEFGNPPFTAYFLTMIAQEEFAKAFLLALVERGVVPWSSQILRATKDHTCKQLLCVVMDYISPDTDEFIERCNAVLLRHEPVVFPSKVASAIDILRYEKIGRWISKNWVWAEELDYDPDALGISRGKRDDVKQDALYTRIAKDGGLIHSRARVNRANLRTEMDRARRFDVLVRGIIRRDPHPILDFDKIERAFYILFSADECK